MIVKKIKVLLNNYNGKIDNSLLIIVLSYFEMF